MPLYETFLWTALGVFISFVLPPLLRAAGATTRTDASASVSSFWARLRPILTSRYAAVTVLSLILALIVVAALEDEISSWNIALISGLGWQSIVARTLTPGS